jgi:uncharacterized membrane protein
MKDILKVLFKIMCFLFSTKTGDLYFEYVFTIFITIIKIVILITYFVTVMWLFIVTVTVSEPVGLLTVTNINAWLNYL